MSDCSKYTHYDHKCVDTWPSYIYVDLCQKTVEITAMFNIGMRWKHCVDIRKPVSSEANQERKGFNLQEKIKILLCSNEKKTCGLMSPHWPYCRVTALWEYQERAWSDASIMHPLYKSLKAVFWSGIASVSQPQQCYVAHLWSFSFFLRAQGIFFKKYRERVVLGQWEFLFLLGLATTASLHH